MADVCSVCLAEKKSLKSLKDVQLVDEYEKLSTIKFNTEDGKPKAICSVCDEKLQRCHTFSNKAIRSDKLLTKFYYERLRFQVIHGPIAEMPLGISGRLSVAIRELMILDIETTNAINAIYALCEN